MAKKLSKELIDTLKDPETLQALGLQPVPDSDLEALMTPPEISDDATAAEVAKAMAAHNAKLVAYIQKSSAKGVEAAKQVLEDDKQKAKDIEIDKFLDEHPELRSNKELLGVVEPLYMKTGDLGDAYSKGCKALGLDPATGKEPEANEPNPKKDKKPITNKVSPLKSDNPSGGDDGGDGGDDDESPKSVEDVLSATANKLAAEGKNPFRQT